MSNVIYLICSLPSLTFGQVPPISFKAFLHEANSQLSAKNRKKLESIDIREMLMNTEKGELKSFIDLLANIQEDISELRQAKANKRNPNLVKLSNSIVDKNPLEREIQIMKWQWEELTSIESINTFTLTEVMVYKLKLQILLRLHSFNAEKGAHVRASIVNSIKKEEA